MTKFYPFGGQTYILGSSIGSTDTSILLDSFTEPVTNTPYTMALLNTDIVFGTIQPRTTSSEFISFTGITQNANGSALLTGVTRGLAKKYPFTSDTAYKLPHSGQSQFIISNPPQLYQEYASIHNDVTIEGLWTFDQNPIGLNPGAVQDASTTVKGIGKLSVPPVLNTNPIFVGDNDTRVPTATEAAALPGTSGTPSGTNKYVTENDTTNGATITATTISFTASTKTISDSGSGFVTAGFRAGDSITVSGTASNNGTYTIVTIASGAIVVAESLVDESAGSSFTIATVTANKLIRFSSTGQYPSTIPLTKIATSAGTTTVTNTAVETSLMTILIPANTLGTSNAVEGSIYISDYVTGSTSMTLRLKYGSSTLGSAVFTNGSATMHLSGKIDFQLIANSATNSQRGNISMSLGNGDVGTTISGTIYGSTRGGTGTSSENSTTTLNILVTVQFSATSVNDSITSDGYVLKKVV